MTADAAFAPAVPENLPARVFTFDEKKKIESIFFEKLKPLFDLIGDFEYFVISLRWSDNNIFVKSGKYIDVPVNIRIEADMVNEAARELVSLPKYTAFARILQAGGSEWRGKIRTRSLRF